MPHIWNPQSIETSALTVETARS